MSDDNVNTQPMIEALFARLDEWGVKYATELAAIRADLEEIRKDINGLHKGQEELRAGQQELRKLYEQLWRTRCPYVSKKPDQSRLSCCRVPTSETQ